MFKLIDLPYKSLAPVISDETLSFHHGKHLQTYVDNLNKLIAGTELEGKSLEEIVVISSGATGGVEKSPAIFNNAGQVLNHELYFTQFKEISPCATLGRDDNSVISSEPVIPSAPFVISSEVEKSHIVQQIQKQWGSLEAFQADFEAKGVSLFGSGWVWLQANADGELSIGQYAGADNPVAHGLRPLLTFDVWEHAYYLDYQNRRAAHLKALWGIVDWNVIEQRYQ